MRSLIKLKSNVQDAWSYTGFKFIFKYVKLSKNVPKFLTNNVYIITQQILHFFETCAKFGVVCSRK